MSGSGKRVSKWDSKEEDTELITRNDYVRNSSGSHFPDKDPEQHASFYPEGNGSSRRSAPDGDDDEHLKSRQHPGENWFPRSRGDAAMMSYHDTRNSSEQDESRKPFLRQSPSRDKPRTCRSGSRSNSRSRSRSPVQRVRRDAGGSSYDRHKTRAGREVDGRFNIADEYDWEAKNRKTRDTSYYTEDSREQYPFRVGGRSDYNSDYPGDNNNSRRETKRRDIPEREYNRISNVPCRYFASGDCHNGTRCRFSHNSGAPPARTSPDSKPQDEMFSRHDNNNHSGTIERIRNSHRWNDTGRSDTGKSSEGAKGNNGNWIDDMEMSPDWNYRFKDLKKPVNEEHGIRKGNLAPAYEHASAAISQQDGNQRSIGMFPTVGEKTVASSHHGFSNNLAPPIQTFNQNHSSAAITSSNNSFSDSNANTAPPVQAVSQNIENRSAVPYQNTPLAVGGSQVLPPAAATHLPGNGNAQNTVSREELNHISNISASLAHLFGNGQPILNLHSTLNAKQAVQAPEIYGKKEHSSHTQTDILNNNSIHTALVTSLQIDSSDGLVSLAANPETSTEENRDRRTDEEASKEPDGRKIGQEETAEDAEKVLDEEEEDENKKKEKDPKGIRAFKFALVEIVKELLKPAWKEGGMNKDAYKNIVKKVVDKVTGAIQTGNVPQTQEKIDHYLSASKPKLTKLVQAYISKVKKS